MTRISITNWVSAKFFLSYTWSIATQAQYISKMAYILARTRSTRLQLYNNTIFNILKFFIPSKFVKYILIKANYGKYHLINPAYSMGKLKKLINIFLWMEKQLQNCKIKQIYTIFLINCNPHIYYISRSMLLNLK